ncbi:MAG: type II toxin-antitoxin system HicB family antitoxin [Acidobacteria bacterium]|nr:type II toxin-antitoxin system HicB family antitoxin [Acidobacteriota bacterium]
MRYPIELEHGKDGAVAISFPDVPEAHTWGDTQEEALEHACDALLSAISIYFDHRKRVPYPSSPKRGQLTVELPASAWAKVLLHNEMVEAGVRPAELARRIGVKKAEVTRILDPEHATKINTIDRALRAVGKHLELSVS